MPTQAHPALESALAELRAFLGDRATAARAAREHHSHDESSHPPALPDLVCFPQSTEEVSRIAAVSARYQLPIVPFGAGTSLEGHVQALRGGISIDMRQMNRILRISVDDMDATVEAGISRVQLAKALENTGLTFFIDPGADATLGGMASTRASGTTAVRYGTMRENVLGLTVVLADGRVIRTGTRARKSSAGYDLTRLFVGAEGTLGVITEVTLRLHGLPEAMAVATCAFPTIDGAIRTVIEVIQLGLGVARIEFMDDRLVNAINRYSKLDLPVHPTLLFEFHGISETVVAETARLAEQLAGEHGGMGFAWETTPAGRERLWKARHDVYYAARAVRPGSDVHHHRRMRAHLAPGRVHCGHARRTRRGHVSGDHRRPRGRRQFSRAVHVCARRGAGGRSLCGPPGGARPGHGRHLHRRARRGLRQKEIPGCRTWRGART